MTDYLTARWYIIKNLSAARLTALHSFELAVLTYAAKNRAAMARAKIMPPLWWQEGALWLRKEFKNFWAENKNCPRNILGFKEELAQILSGSGLAPGGGEIFKDINLMHRCDLAINQTSCAPKPRLLPVSSRQPQPTP